MACLDAAARFRPALTSVTTAASRERRTTAGATTYVGFSVIDREAAAVSTRNEFSMVLSKLSHSLMSIDGTSHTKATENVNFLTNPLKDSSGRPRWKGPLQTRRFAETLTLMGNLWFTDSAEFQTADCFKLPARKQAIMHGFWGMG